MSRNKKKSPKVAPSLALAMVAICTPVMMGVFTTSARDAREVAASGISGHKNFIQSTLDFVKFRKHVRGRHADEQNASRSTSSSAESSVSSSEADADLELSDLSTTERETIRRQLRRGGCPFKADLRYRKLCEELLSQQKHRAAQEGLKNSDAQ